MPTRGRLGGGRILRIGGKGWETRRVRQFVVMVTELVVSPGPKVSALREERSWSPRCANAQWAGPLGGHLLG